MARPNLWRWRPREATPSATRIDIERHQELLGDLTSWYLTFLGRARNQHQAAMIRILLLPRSVQTV
jgi:hypothetical protein